MEKLTILFEDQDLLLLKKPIGILSQEGDGETVPSLLKNSERDYIGIIHRLDRNVGGTMVYAKNKEAAAKLSTMVSEHSVIKEYLAIVEGEVEKEGIWEDLLFKDSSKNKVFVVKKERKGVKKAKLAFQCLAQVQDGAKTLSLVQIRLYTGRTHQIRVQFASRKHPLVGDGKYGSKNNRCEEALWCYRLSFEHPRTKEKMTMHTLPEQSYPWNLFDVEQILSETEK